MVTIMQKKQKVATVSNCEDAVYICILFLQKSTQMTGVVPMCVHFYVCVQSQMGHAMAQGQRNQGQPEFTSSP